MTSPREDADRQKISTSDITLFRNQELGRGAYGNVFKAEYRGSPCVAKELEYFIIDKEAFIRECSHSNPNHPNIVHFIGIYCPPQQLWLMIIMELMDESLTTYAIRNVSFMNRISILHDVAEGLCYLHSRNPTVIHGGLSPNSILLKHLPACSVAKIADVGIARMIDINNRLNSRLVNNRYGCAVSGSVDFIPLDVLQYGSNRTSLDIFSYGGIILHTINGEWLKPLGRFKQVDLNLTGILLTEVERRQEHLDKMTEEAKALKPLVISCLDNDPNRRPTIFEICTKIKAAKRVKLIENLNKAKKDHRTIPVRFLKVIVAGSGAAGKTNFINLLMKKEFKQDHHSTNVVHANHAVSFRMATFQELPKEDNEVTWVELDSNLEIGYLKSVLFPEAHELPVSPKAAEESDDMVGTDSNKAPSKSQSSVPKQQSIFQKWFAKFYSRSTKQSRLPTAGSIDDSNLPTADSIDNFSTAVSIDDSSLSTVDDILNSQSSQSGSIYQPGGVLNIITLLDTGGQPEYIHLLPTININPTVTFVIHNLTKSLDDQVLVEYSQHGKHTFKPYHLSYSNINMIKFLMSTVNDSVERPACNASELQLGMKPGSDDKSYICLVGTHADKVSQVDKESTAKKLGSLVNQTQCHASVWYQETENVLFSVNNTTAGKECEDPVAKNMRSKIETLASKKEIYELPITWMLFQLEVRQVCSQRKQSYISLNDCVTIAKESGLIPNKQEVENVLQYYHILGVLIYFHEVSGLCDYVIVDHQWWFDKLSNVICITFQENYLNYKTVRKLKYQGMLSKELVKHVEWKDDIKEDFFFSLLIRLKIISPVHNKQDDIEEYFIPFILSAYDLQHESEILAQYGCLQGEPLLIQFCSGLLPRGLFCSLLVQLLQYPLEKSKPHFSQDEETQHAFSNLFTFGLPNAYSFSLLDKLSHLEVQIRHPKKNFHIPVHAQVYNYLIYVLTDVCNHLKFNFDRLRYGFLCKCGKCTEDHVAVLPEITPSMMYAECSINSIYKMELSSSHLIWFSYDERLAGKVDGDHVNDLRGNLSSNNEQKQAMKRPNMRLLHEIVVPRIAANWSIVADFLEYELEYKQLIREKCRDDPQRCCVELLEDWLSSNRGVFPKSWSKLIEVLRGIKSLKATTEKIVENLATAGVNV